MDARGILTIQRLDYQPPCLKSLDDIDRFFCIGREERRVTNMLEIFQIYFSRVLI